MCSYNRIFKSINGYRPIIIAIISTIISLIVLLIVIFQVLLPAIPHQETINLTYGSPATVMYIGRSPASDHYNLRIEVSYYDNINNRQRGSIYMDKQVFPPPPLIPGTNTNLTIAQLIAEAYQDQWNGRNDFSIYYSWGDSNNPNNPIDIVKSAPALPTFNTNTNSIELSNAIDPPPQIKRTIGDGVTIGIIFGLIIPILAAGLSIIFLVLLIRDYQWRAGYEFHTLMGNGINSSDSGNNKDNNNNRILTSDDPDISEFSRIEQSQSRINPPSIIQRDEEQAIPIDPTELKYNQYNNNQNNSTADPEDPEYSINSNNNNNGNSSGTSTATYLYM